MPFPEAWDNFFLMSITRRGGSELQIAAMVDPKSVKIKEGEHPAESMINAAAGRIWMDGPQADGEITFDIIELELDSASAVGLIQQYFGRSGGEGTAYDTAEPLTTVPATAWAAGVNRVRDMFRIAVMRTNDVAATTAGGATLTATDTLRFYANNCKFVDMDHDFDGSQKATVTFKFKPFNKAGTIKNADWESGDQTAIPALNTYTAANWPN